MLSFEHVSLGRARLFSAFRHERLRGESIEFSKPCGHITEDWFYQDTSPGAANPDAVALETELARQSNCLASTVLEEFSCDGHRTGYIPLV
jgi:hypothetical protein